MFPFWLIVGSAILLMGVFNRQMLHLLGIRPMSEVFKTPGLKQSSRRIEQIGRWFLIVLGLSFLVQGLGDALPAEVSAKISLVLAGLSGLLFLAMFGIAIVSWKAR
jgi:hypothetical protein